jgi:hypothetical protein
MVFLKNIEKSVSQIKKAMPRETTYNLMVVSTLLSEDKDKLNKLFTPLKKDKTNKTNELELKIKEINKKWESIECVIPNPNRNYINKLFFI